MRTKRKGLVFLCICLVLVVFLYACESTPAEVVDDIENQQEESPQIELAQDERTTLQILLDIANERRLGIEKVDEEVVRELAYRRDFTFYDLSDIMMSPTDRWWSSSITSDEAIEDVETLFEVLRYVYGAYLYFGGDEVFAPAKEQIIADIRQGGDRHTEMEFSLILYRHLSSIIRDNHFFIGTIPFRPEYTFLVSRDIFFDQTEQGFRNRETGLYIEEIPGHDMMDTLRLQLDESGQHFYAPVLQREGTSGASKTLTVLYEDGTSEGLELRTSSLIRRNVFGPPSSLTYVDGFPVVSLDWMMGMGAIPYGAYAHAFLGYAEELRDEPVVILDLRSNGGGCSALPLKWMYLLTGEVVRGNGIRVSNWGIEYEYPWTPWGGTPETNRFYLSYENLANLVFLRHYVSINGFPVSNLIERHIVEREQVLIVLVDRLTTSSGDSFADLAFNVKNTLVIGQNTHGNLISDGAYQFLRMPNSGIPFGLGRGVKLFPEGHLPEGIGIRPDVWVTGDALAAAIAMLTNK